MAITSRSGQIVALDKFIEENELNVDTRGILQEIYAICQRVDRSTERENKFKSKRMGGGTNEVLAIKMPPPFVANDYVEPEKKSLNAQQLHVEREIKDVEIEASPETFELQVFEMYLDGLDTAKEVYKNPKDFKKALNKIGVKSEGKTFESLWDDLGVAYEKINT